MKTSGKSRLEKTVVVVLSGGQGLRLKSVTGSSPKTMAEIQKRPFLDILLEYASGYGLKRFVLCTGYGSDLIKDYYEKSDNNFEVVISNEDVPLGTGGAVKNAESHVGEDTFFVINGDSFCPVNLQRFYEFHMEKKALVSIVVTRAVDDSRDCGLVTLDEQCRITGFDEKAGAGEGFVNAGIYLFQREALLMMPGGKYSLEKDFFPGLIGSEFYGFVTGAELLDIGTPERYARAQKFFSSRTEKPGKQK